MESAHLLTAPTMLSTSTLSQALDAVAQLDRDLSVALGYADVVAAHTYDDARTLWDLRRSLEQSVFVARTLRETLLAEANSVAADHLEVVLRERNAAIVLRLTELTANEHEVRGEGRDLFTGRFQNLRDFNIYVIDQLSVVNESCFSARLAAQRWSEDQGTAHAERREAYRSTLLSAHRALTSIGTDVDLVAFLNVGASFEFGHFGAACRALALLLDVPLAPNPTHATVAPTEGAR